MVDQKSKQDHKREMETKYNTARHVKADRLYALAWDYGHSAGLDEVELYYADMVELLTPTGECMMIYILEDDMGHLYAGVAIQRSDLEPLGPDMQTQRTNLLLALTEAGAIRYAPGFAGSSLAVDLTPATDAAHPGG